MGYILMKFWRYTNKILCGCITEMSSLMADLSSPAVKIPA